ncbi:DUF5129 domain-containing protein [Brachybacterium sp. J144]|uniref:DUF5129 domain-containing protein n=1 Tax=Brachybacterium sp. J144 TaxID=3116487 RepID=UPI002E779C81|nr:DUF5129 domain-containing protein [Brachybacterium sp. J144]MEE1649374.1 DUF5129 domain-containing protein [Brachybacterium sp. J144]
MSPHLDAAPVAPPLEAPAAVVAPPRPAPADTRGLLLLAVLLAVLLGALLAPLSAARAEGPREVLVHDTVGVLDEERITESLASTDFRTEVRLVVLVLDVSDAGFDPADDLALNDAVLDFARQQDLSLIAAGGDVWAEGTVILALDPRNRFLGTYAGEDVKLTDSEFEAVQDAMREPARASSWDGALEAGAERYAQLLLRPWWQSPAGVGVLVVSGLSALGGGLGLLGARGGARRRADESLARLAGIEGARLRTEEAARTLPTASDYARAARADHETFVDSVERALTLRGQLPTSTTRHWSWGLRGADRRLARELEAAVDEADLVDDLVVEARDLLTRTEGWKTVWAREIAPLRDAIASLEEAPLADGDASTEEQAAADSLHALGVQAGTEIDELTEALEQRRTTPDEALERLDTLTRELSAATVMLQSSRISRLAQDDTEEDLLRRAEESPHELRRYRSLRARRHALEGSSSPDAGQPWHLNPVLWYTSWQHTADTSLDQHRNPPASSSGSSVSGFSSGSSGGFSGAGSSSRF